MLENIIIDTKTENLTNRVFQNHYDFHKNIGVDIIKSASGHMDQVSADYQGRVLYELLQNAFDRAKNKIIVKVIGKTLYVANDGKKFTFNSEHDYKDGRGEGKQFNRSDFHSLCSISTSNKTASESIGNKGVGFKSVYALGHYANIHTKGLIGTTLYKEEVNISFRLYDLFKDLDKIPTLLNKELRDHLINTIEAVQYEYKDRGVPGYYFPIQLETNNSIFNQFDSDIVTIIEVPFSSKEEVENLIEEIKHIHFGFVGLKYTNNIEIKFETETHSFNKNNNIQNDTLFSANLDSTIITAIAQKAGISIKNPSVAIKFKKEPTGLFYNYLPTQKKAPFKYVDFHADFHTTVDRKDINFDGEKVGAYNRALLDACLELYYTVLKSYLKDNSKILLKTKYITKTAVQLNKFDWNYIKIKDASKIYNKTRNLFSVDDYIDQNNKGNNRHYTQLVLLFSSISKEYFEPTCNTKTHTLFFDNIIEFIGSFTNDYKKLHIYSRSNEFKRELFSEIKRLNAKVIPNIDLSETSELFYRNNDSQPLSLPKSISIKITDFEIADPIAKSELDVKDFTEYNALLKHYRQCSCTGVVSEQSISEQEQEEILKSCFELYQSKTEKNYLSSHRFANYFISELSDKTSTNNQANSNVATLFLKLINGKYKPAQLCSKNELDFTFFSFLGESDSDNWLRYLGVSTEKNYRFVDSIIYDKLDAGLDIIPRLLTTEEHKENTSDKLVNLHIVSSKQDLIHPALINDNNYSFLTSLSSTKLKPEFDNLHVKNYRNFPLAYLTILRKKLDENLIFHKRSIIQFYQNIFEVYARQEWYLIYQNDTLSWVQDQEFYILKNKVDFALCVKQFPQKAILAYYLGKSSKLENKLIHPEKGTITYSKKSVDITLKERITERLPFILINLSHSKNSESNYLSEDENLSKLQIRFESMTISLCDTLEQSLDFKGLGSDISPKAYAHEETELFIASTATKSQSSQAICDYLFHNISIKDQVELILFHKELAELAEEIDANELETIHRKWKPDYQEKFNEYQQKILSNYNVALEDNVAWFRYSNANRNKFLVNLDKDGKLNDLKSIINQNKTDFEGYFDNFKLEIDYTHITKDIVVIIEYNRKLTEDPELNNRLKTLIEKGKKKTLGIEDEIDALKREFPQIFAINNTHIELKNKVDDFEAIQDIEAIYTKIKNSFQKQLKHTTLDSTNQTNINIPVNHKQIIFQGNSVTPEGNKKLEITGASGEVEVLICLINDFILLDNKERKVGIQAIKLELQKHAKNSFDTYADNCLKVLTDNDKLRKALIPLCYVAKKYKCANFDLITYKNGNATLIEVKTTNNVHNKRFYISIAEVNTARVHSNYEIVRVTPTSIIFMGNPIKEIDASILEIKTNGFRLKPRNYELIIN